MMSAKPQCDACFLRQAENAAQLAGLDRDAQRRLLRTVRAELARWPAEAPAPVKASDVHALVRAISGHPDPYRAAKRKATEEALQLLPALRARVRDSADPLATAVRLAIAGNIIDLGVAPEYDLEGSIERVLSDPLAIDHVESLRAALDAAENILYLADNAGETVLDRLLIERIRGPVTYAVKGGPAVNDATREDALAADIGSVAAIIDHGAATLGTLLDRCSVEFRQAFDSADVVIAKGMANFESLEGSRERLFFLLQAKCQVVAAHLSVPEHALIVLENGSRAGR